MRGNVTAVQRTWLARYGARKAPIEDPRRSLGHQLGSGVRLGLMDYVLTVGEGLETMLSLRSVLPQMPMLAGLSANHLAALGCPSGSGALRRRATTMPRPASRDPVRERIQSQGVDVCTLQPAYADFNVDLAASDLGLCVSGLHASSSRRIANALRCRKLIPVA